MGDNDNPDQAPSSAQRYETDDVIDLDVREIDGGIVARAARDRHPSLARSAGETAMSLGLAALHRSADIGFWFYRRARDSGPGRVLSDMTSGAVDALVDDADVDWRNAGRVAEEQISHVIAVVAPVVVQALDPNELMKYIDVDAIVDALDVNALMERVDVDALISRIDVNALMERVDVDMILDHVDVDALLARVDVNVFLEGVDIDAIAANVDIDAILASVDVARVAQQANIGELVAQSTSDVAGSALDMGRRQGVAVDTLLARTVNRVLGRDSDAMPQGPPRLVDESEEASS